MAAFERQESRAEDLQRIASGVAALVNPYIREPLVISYVKMTEEALDTFSDWDKQRFGILRSEEYFIIRRCNRDDELLYFVDITADSLFTAMKELTDKIAKKF